MPPSKPCGASSDASDQGLGSPLSGAGAASKVGGFSILQAESAETLQKLLEDHPHRRAPGASIDFLEFLPMPGAPQK